MSDVVKLVEAIWESLPASMEWSEREATLLDLAERQARDIDRLEADIAGTGVRTSSGRLSQALAEGRMGRVALSRILGQIDVPAEVSPRRLHGRKAAQARWRRDATSA